MKNLSWDEFKALSEAKQAAYQKHIDEAVERLAVFSPITMAEAIFTKAGCWNIKIKGRTPIGNHFTIEHGGAEPPSAQELKRRRIEARAEYDAKFGPDGQDS